MTFRPSQLPRTMKPSELPDWSPTDWVAWDTETSGLYVDDGARVAVVSVAWFDESAEDGIQAVAFPFDQGPQNKPGWNGQGSLFEQDDPNLPESEWVELLRRLQIPRLVAHNAQFDLLLTAAGTRFWPGVDLSSNVEWDTMLGQRIVWPQAPRGLKPAMDRLRPGRGETDAAEALKKHLGPKTDPRYDLVPWELIRAYATKDAAQTLWLQRAQARALEAGEAAEGSGWWLHHDLEIAKLLTRMEQRGDTYDAAESHRVAGLVDRKLRELGATIPFPHTDPGARKAFSVTSLTAEVLADLVAAEGQESLAGRWQRYKKLQTANKMWYRGYADKVGKDGRLRTRFRQLGARTGRSSCERVNLQATPADFRFDGFKDLEGLPTPRQLQKSAVPAGWKRVQLDLAQAELRVAVGVVANEAMAEMIAKGLDLHGETAKQLFNVRESSPDWAFRRQLAKRSNFSLINGVGWATFRGTIHKETGEWLSEQETRYIVSKWNRLYPQHKAEIYKAMERAQRAKSVPLANGRRRYFAAYEDYYKAHGNSVQGSIGFLTLDWLLECEAICQEWRVEEQAAEDGIGGAGVVSSVHDSVYLLVPADQAAAIGAACQDAVPALWDEYFHPANNGRWSRIHVPGRADLEI